MTIPQTRYTVCIVTRVTDYQSFEGEPCGR